MSNLPITQSHLPDTSYRFHRHLKKNDHTPIPLRWYCVLSLHLSGKSPKEVMQETGYSTAMYYRILNDPAVQSVRQQLLDSTQQEFEALFNQVVENIRNQLKSTDEQIQIAAQNQFFKATGKFAPKVSEKGDGLTVEDVVAKLLNVNIQVNVDSNK